MDLYHLQGLGIVFLRERPFLFTGVLAVGAFSVLRCLYQTLSVIFQLFILPGHNLRRFGAKQGAWAVVTGASDGIGKEFAFQLAKSGFNVFLVARNKGLLMATASEIEKKYPSVATAIHSIDFSANDEAAYDHMFSSLKALDIGVLVNNVGKSHNVPVYFADTPKDEMADIVSINVNATLRVTHGILPGMIKKKRGLILNIGSLAGAVPSPMLATYSGTKAFLSTFSSALGEEVKAHNIVVEHVNTYFVVSKMSKIRKASAAVPEPASYVRAVLSKIGLACGAAYSGRPNTSTPFWSHGLLDYGLTLLSSPGMAIRYTHGLHKSIRKRALRKLERESKGQ